jgi:hypothetical protein
LSQKKKKYTAINNKNLRDSPVGEINIFSDKADLTRATHQGILTEGTGSVQLTTILR